MRRNQSEEEKPQRNGTSKILCKHCGKEIIQSNYLIHEARCGLKSSRIYRSEEEPQKFQMKPREKESYPSVHPQFRKEQVRPSALNRQRTNPNSNFGQRPRIFQQNRVEEQQKIPCPFCGYKQTLAELDTHPQQCEHREQECPQCHQTFPRSLMDEHLQICSARRHHHHHHPQPMPYEEQEEEYEENYNPFGNFGNIFSMMRRPERHSHQNNPPERRSGGGFVIIERSDNRGNVFRQVIPSGDMQEGFARRGGAQYSPFTNFFALVELLAGRQSRQDQGLTKEEIRGLKRIKYSGNNQTKDKDDKDLCTICYCQFQKDQQMIELRCKHIFHEECITKWVERTAKCPICKAPQTDRPVFEGEDD